MLVLGVDLLVLLDHVDLQVAVRLPLWLSHLDHGHLLGEDSVADIISQQLFTYTTILLALVHKCAQIQREVDCVVE